MTKYSEKLIEFYTKDGRKPVFIEKYWEITPETPIADILYTYNEMACRGYLLEERGYFLENAQHYSRKPAFEFLYPGVILDVPFEKHPYVVARENFIKETAGRKLTEEDFNKLKEIEKLKDYA